MNDTHKQMTREMMKLLGMPTERNSENVVQRRNPDGSITNVRKRSDLL